MKTGRKTLILTQNKFCQNLETIPFSFRSTDKLLRFCCYKYTASVKTAPVAATSCYQAIIYFSVLRKYDTDTIFSQLDSDIPCRAIQAGQI